MAWPHRDGPWRAPFRLFRMHWAHEPTPNPSQEGNGDGADEPLLPCSKGLEGCRFVEGIGVVVWQAYSIRRCASLRTGQQTGRK